MRTSLVEAAALIFFAFALVSAKPPAQPANFDPEIGYTYASGNYMDLRLANRAGSAAILVHRSAFGAISGFDLAPEQSEAGAVQRIAFIDRENLFVKTWTKNPVAVSGTPELLYDGIGTVETVDFSPDGSQLVFNTLGNDVFKIIVHDFAPDAGQESQRIVPTNLLVSKVRWDDTGNSIFVIGRPTESPTDAPALYRVDLSGNATKLRDLPSSNTLLDFDVSKAPPSDGSRIAMGASGEVSLLAFSGALQRIAAKGSLAHFNCNNTAIIHRGADRKRSTTITSLLPNVSPQTWSSDSNIHHTDWLQRLPCGA